MSLEEGIVITENSQEYLEMLAKPNERVVRLSEVPAGSRIRVITGVHQLGIEVSVKSTKDPYALIHFDDGYEIQYEWGRLVLLPDPALVNQTHTPEQRRKRRAYWKDRAYKLRLWEGYMDKELTWRDGVLGYNRDGQFIPIRGVPIIPK